MLKEHEIVKDVESRFVDAARDRLRDVPGLQVESVEHDRRIGRGDAVDGLVELGHDGGAYTLVAGVRSNGAFRFVRAGLHQLESCVSRLRRSGDPKILRAMGTSLSCVELVTVATHDL